MSRAFEILSEAFDEAIKDAKSEKPFLKRETISVKIDKSKNFSADNDDEKFNKNDMLDDLTA